MSADHFCLVPDIKYNFCFPFSATAKYFPFDVKAGLLIFKSIVSAFFPDVL